MSVSEFGAPLFVLVSAAGWVRDQLCIYPRSSKYATFHKGRVCEARNLKYGVLAQSLGMSAIGPREIPRTVFQFVYGPSGLILICVLDGP